MITLVLEDGRCSYETPARAVTIMRGDSYATALPGREGERGEKRQEMGTPVSLLPSSLSVAPIG
jgi:hypothetical protein